MYDLLQYAYYDATMFRNAAFEGTVLQYTVSYYTNHDDICMLIYMALP